MNSPINNNTPERYYQILQELGINKDVSWEELVVIETEMVNEASEALKLKNPSYDELQKKCSMVVEASHNREALTKQGNKNLSIDRYYQELGLSKNITFEEAIRVQDELIREFTEANVLSYETGDVTISGKASIKCSMISGIIHALSEEKKYGEKREVKENTKQIEAQKELNNVLREGVENGKGVDNEKVSKAVRKVAPVNQELVKKTAEIRKSGGENNGLSSNQKPITQGESEIDKDALIAQLKKEIAELKKKLNPNNAEQKILLSKKEAQLAELENKKKSIQSDKNQETENSENLPVKIAMGGGIVLSMLVISVMVWRWKINKSKKRV